MKVGILGLGTMGSGIAQVIAKAGYSVVAVEVSEEALNRGINRIKSFMQRGIELGKNTQKDLQDVLTNIQQTTAIENLAYCDLVIEAVPENLELKHEVFKKIDQVVGPDTLLATNTSGIAVHEIAKALNQPERLFGLHFFNPAPLMKLVEIIRPIDFSEEVINQVKEFCIKIGKEPVVVKDRPGFLVNRLLIPYLNMAAEGFDTGLASKEDIDVAIELGLGYPMGPLRLLDQIGLDVHLAATTSVYEQTFLPEFRPPAILKELVNKNRLGKKTGSGFHTYN